MSFLQLLAQQFPHSKLTSKSPDVTKLKRESGESPWNGKETSVQPLVRLDDGRAQITHEFSGTGAIDHAMVTRKRKRHHGTNRRLAFDGDHSFGDSPHGENGRLCRRNDRGECVHAIHTEIAD